MIRPTTERRLNQPITSVSRFAAQSDATIARQIDGVCWPACVVHMHQEQREMTTGPVGAFSLSDERAPEERFIDEIWTS